MTAAGLDPGPPKPQVWSMQLLGHIQQLTPNSNLTVNGRIPLPHDNNSDPDLGQKCNPNSDLDRYGSDSATLATGFNILHGKFSPRPVI